MKKKIIDAQIFRTKISSKTIWLFVLLKDSNNIEGWGEATLSGKDNEIFKIKDKTFEIILNKIYTSPLEFKNILPFENIVQASISSAIMQCLWDIQGQIEKKAINEIFHQKRKQIEVYANFNRSTSDRTLEGVRLNSQKVRDHGYRFVKFAPFDEVSPDMDTNTILKSMRKGLDRIEVMRNVFGPKVNIMIDCHWRFNYDSAVQLLKECKKHNLYWLECPIEENIKNLPLIRKLRLKANSFGIKLAGLETKILKKGFHEYVKAETYDVMMPDIKYAGGPDEILDIEKMLIKNNISFSPHNPSGPISHAHTLQICGATHEDSLMEHQFKESLFFEKLLKTPNPEIKHGRSLIPKYSYGLGVSINKLELKNIE